MYLKTDYFLFNFLKSCDVFIVMSIYLLACYSEIIKLIEQFIHDCKCFLFLFICRSLWEPRNGDVQACVFQCDQLHIPNLGVHNCLHFTLLWKSALLGWAFSLRSANPPKHAFALCCKLVSTLLFMVVSLCVSVYVLVQA